MLQRVIFSIDNGKDLHTRKKFLRYIDNLHAVGKVSSVQQCIGMWEGELETSYMMLAKDYESHVQPHQCVKHQVCILRVPGDTRQPCVLEYSDGEQVSVGRMVEVTYGDAMSREGWTYVEETRKFFTTEQ